MRAFIILILLGCGGGGTAQVEHTLRFPDAREERDGAIAETGRRMYRLLRTARPERLLLDDEELSRLLEPNAASQARALRPGVSQRLNVESARFRALDNAEFSGICLQGAREEPANGRLGLLEPAWVFARALVVGTQPGGRRLASWVEGAFVYTNEGFQAIALTRVEPPRWEHSDLELTTCDMEVGLTRPLDVVVATE